MTYGFVMVNVHSWCDTCKPKTLFLSLTTTTHVPRIQFCTTHRVCRCPWGMRPGWRSRAALLDKCWHKQKADSLLCQVVCQGEQLAMNAKFIFIARLRSSQRVHWSQCSHKLSFAEPSRHAEGGNVCTRAHTQSSLSCSCQVRVRSLCLRLSPFQGLVKGVLYHMLCCYCSSDVQW